MAEIKSVSEIAKKWARVTPMRLEDYQAGVASPRRSWAEGAIAAKTIWKDAITTAANRDAYGKGVALAGDTTWKTKTMQKGPARWSEGVSIGEADYQKGFAPYADVIKATVLPPRYPRRDPRNIERVKAIVDALGKKKIAG